MRAKAEDLNGATVMVSLKIVLVGLEHMRSTGGTSNKEEGLKQENWVKMYLHKLGLYLPCEGFIGGEF